MNTKRIATVAALAFAQSFFFVTCARQRRGRAIHMSVCSACAHAKRYGQPAQGGIRRWQTLSRYEATTENAVTALRRCLKGGASELPPADTPGDRVHGGARKMKP
jgi:hypothetical protein